MCIRDRYLSGFLIGLGMGGVVGASTLGVAMFSLVAPEGHLKEFTAMVPVVNCVSSLATVSVYMQQADWGLVKRMWPWILLGILLGTAILPILHESQLRRLTSIVYGVILAQRLVEKGSELGVLATISQKLLGTRATTPKDPEQVKAERMRFYKQWWVGAAVSVLCGVVTVVTNNSGPIFNIYLLACGLDMDQFVASRSVMMSGKNVAKAVARLATGGLTGRVLLHGLCVGVLSYLGIQVAKPIKARTSVEFYTYFTWAVLLYTAVKMWSL
eukprot:TRINITY_DN49981_c0_g1_i1.p1 TRINITY_DN49981_c0_g1~~TRINITY_DN49981_c0_g1_i1.p1  ORF type:complete len:271 (+),score=70.27 TRINITY_DN49981_c0_g1_i1:170-982(+)